MKLKNITNEDSKVFCSNSSLGLIFSDFKISSLKVFNFLLIFTLMLSLSLSIFSNPIFADETNSNAKQESVQNQETNQNQKAAQDFNQANTQDAVQKQVPSQNAEVVKGIKSPQKVMLNGRDVEISAYNINNENYFKLRDIAALVTDTNKSFDVFYNKEKNMIEITKNKKYQKIEGDLAPLADGKVEGIKSPQILEIDKKQEDVRAYNIMGNNYYRLRDLGEKLGLEVSYVINVNKVSIVSEKVPQMAVPGEVKYIREVDSDGTTAVRRLYPPEIENAPMRTCYPRAPKGQIVYDVLERCHFNDKGEPVGPNGGKIDQTFRENLARRMGVDPFSFDLRRVRSGSEGGSEDVIVGGSNG